MERGADAGKKAKARGGVWRIAALLILFAVIVGVLYVFATYGSLPVAVLTAKHLNSSTLASIMLAKINSQPQANIVYNGSIAVNGTDPGFYIEYVKDGSYSSTKLVLGRILGIGSYSAIVYIYNSTGPDYACTSFYNADNPNSSYALNCSYTYYPYAALTRVADTVINVSTLNNVRTTAYGLSSFYGQPCYNISGTGTVDVNGTLFNDAGYLPSSINFTACLSAQYNIPLIVTARATVQGGGYVTLIMKQSSFSNSYTRNETAVGGQITTT